MADLATIEYWRKRTRDFEIALIVSVVAIMLLHTFVAIRVNPYWLFVLPVSVALLGGYCWHRERKAFVQYETENGAANQEAQGKWNQKYPNSGD